MRREGKNSDEIPANLTADAVNFDTYKMWELVGLEAVLAENHLDSLLALYRRARTWNQKSFSIPLSLEQLEMFEAELSNQDLLRRRSDSVRALHQHAAHQINLLLWRAKRLGHSTESYEFLIDIPYYILECSIFMLKNLSTGRENDSDMYMSRGTFLGWSAENSTKLLYDLNYLDDFATYLLGAFNDQNSRYHKGLDLVLNVLKRNSATSASHLQITLPISADEFTRHIALR